MTDVDHLVAAWLGGDDTARDSVLREVRRRSVRYLLGLRVPAADCEDLAQEVCLAVLDAVPRWTGPFWPLVFSIARNKSVDRVRRDARAAVVGRTSECVEVALAGRPAATAGPETQVLEREGAERVSSLLAVLPATQRDVLLLRVVVGLSVAETAHALGLRHGSVHVIQHRGLKRLRDLLGAQP